MKYSVYVLVDPRNGSVHYVGITKNVEQRYYYHCLGCDSTSKACAWIRKLKEQDIKPLLVIVEEVDGWDAAYRRETYWMNLLLEAKTPLLNYVAPIRRRKKEVA